MPRFMQTTLVDGNKVGGPASDARGLCGISQDGRSAVGAPGAAFAVGSQEQRPLADRAADSVAGRRAVASIHSEGDLVRAAWQIIRSGSLARLSSGEADLVRSCRTSAADSAETAGAAGGVRAAAGVGAAGLVGLIRGGGDPLGEAFIRLRPREQRRQLGATYTPDEIVSAMVAWVAGRACPARVVDPGAGSARFLLAAGRVFSNAALVGVELDPLAALLARANLTATGFDARSRVVVADYRTADLGGSDEVTAFIGNPPYVRHHQIEAHWKRWLRDSSALLGFKSSGLSGLHVHFLVATALHARRGDVGAFVTSAEWLDVNYGSLPRRLISTRLGGVCVHLVDPEALPFAGAATTAAVTCFKVGADTDSIRIQRVGSASRLGALDGGRPFSRRQLQKTPKWSTLLNKPPTPPEGYVELGELCRVHRGAVTGANSTWITDADDPALPPGVLFPCVTRAKELFDIGSGALTDTGGLRTVVGLPADLDELDAADRRRVDRFLRAAQSEGVASGYTARHRKPWWSIKLRAPAPILATYMARRPPAFVRNPAGARNVNVAHGVYPREPMPDTMLDALAAALREAAATAVGRTYAGGLVKFEPSEMARIRIPGPEMLQTTTSRGATPGVQTLDNAAHSTPPRCTDLPAAQLPWIAKWHQSPHRGGTTPSSNSS